MEISTACDPSTYVNAEMIYWRVASSGNSRSAFYVGKVLSTFFRIALSSLHFTVFFSILATPLIPFGSLFIANLLYFYCKITSFLGVQS